MKYADKGGASKGKAKKVTKGKMITGVMPAGEKASKADWFKFKVTQKKILEIDLAASGDGRFTYYLYGPGYKKSGYKIGSFMNEAQSFDSGRYGKVIRVSKGTYYLKVVRASGNYKKSSGAYAFRWNLR